MDPEPRTDPPTASGSGVDGGGVDAGATPAEALTGRLRRDLTVAMRERDQVRVRALRTTLAAIANAEAPEVGDGPSATEAIAHPVVGSLVEHRRLELAAADLDAILAAEVADRLDTAAQFEAHGRADEAATVRAEAAVIATYRS